MAQAKRKPDEAWLNETMADGVLFAQRILGEKTWDVQERVIRTLTEHSLSAFAGCHASSKTRAAGMAAAYWLTRYKNGVVVIMSPTETQSKQGIWREMRLAIQRSKVAYDTEPGEREWKLSGENYATIRSPAKGGKGVRLHGIHAENLLILADEAPGIDAEMFEGLDGLRAGGNVHVGLFGNPTIPGGYFYECFTRDRARWNTIMIDGMDTPNLRGITLEQLCEMDMKQGGPLDENPWPFLITRRFVREMRDTWGEANPRFESRVRGRFPMHDEDALIPLVWLEAARNRDTQLSGRRFTAGIDVAGGGRAENVIYIVDKGHIVTPYPFISTADVYTAKKRMLEFLEQYRRDLGVIYYDASGQGSWFGAILRDNKYNVSAFQFGEASSDPEMFKIRRDEGFWRMRECFRTNEVAGLLDETTIAQLSAIRYDTTTDPKNRVKVESKKDLAKRGIKSPDRADALMMALAGSFSGAPTSIPEPGAAIRSRIRWKID